MEKQHTCAYPNTIFSYSFFFVRLYLWKEKITHFENLYPLSLYSLKMLSDNEQR